MLTASELKEIFENPYNRKSWYRILRENFNVSVLKEKPDDITKRIKTNAYDAKAYELGNFNTNDDGHLIGLYEVEVPKKAQLHRNRKGLRNLLSQVYASDVEAALLVFIQGNKWRFSYVSEITVKNKTTGKREKKTTDPKRFTYLLGEGERAKTAADRFAGIQKKEDLFGGGVTLAALEDAFNVEKMSKAFFNEYRKHYGYFTAQLTGEDENGKKIKNASPFLKSTFNGNHKEARDFVKKMLGRIVFLYFLEKKGWLGVPENGKWGDGDENFLSNLFRDCKHKETFYSAVLVPLFFATLNTERKDDYFKVDQSLFTKPGYNKLRIPYLNGGLFEEDNVNTQFLVFPKTLFENLFGFFDQYNFTVYEDSPDEHTVAVDPEMLGHIFENLLEDNKDKGAFYTPKEIVHYMCRESLIEYLYTKLNPATTDTYQELGKLQTDMFGNAAKKGQLSLEQKHTPKEIISRTAIEKYVLHHEAADIIEYEEPILKALQEVKICDPAIGSGAFPMGLLIEIYYLVETLFEISQDVVNRVWKLGTSEIFNAAKVKEQIIQNSIYGVDIEKGAVDIARLRFWLSLVVDETKPKPLPNLDYKIVVGNSLLSKFEDEVIDIDWNIKTKIASTVAQIINDQQAKLVLLHTRQYEYFQAGIDKPKQQQRIRDLKIDILINQLTLERIAYTDNNAMQKSAFPTDKEKKRAEAIIEKIRDFNRTIHKLEAIKKDKNQALDFFDWRLNFPEILNEKVNSGKTGFDIVIANPPYISAIDLKKIYSEKEYKAIKINYETAKGTVDAYIYFFEKGLKLLKNNGTLSFITPNRYLSASYGGALRKFIFENQKIISIVDYSDEKVFANASTYPILTFLSNQKTVNTYKMKIGKYIDSKKTAEFKNISSHKLDLVEDYIWGFLLNEKIGITEKIMNQSKPLSEFCDIGATSTAGEADLYHNLIGGRSGYKLINTGTIDRYCTLWGNQELTDKGEKYLKPYLPHNSSIISKNRNRLYSSPKIILAKIALRAEAFYDEEGTYASVNTNCLYNFKKPGTEKYILAWMNSKLFTYCFECFFEGLKMAGGYLLYSAPNLSALYLKDLSGDFLQDFAKEVDLILAEKKKDVYADICQFENKIDILFYKLYKLTFQEACIVENNETWMTKTAYENYSIK